MRIDLAGVVTALRAGGCVFAEDEAALLTAEARTPEQLAELVGRRLAGEPLEHVLGWVSFAGLRLAVTSGVFVPRRRTELLAREAVRALRPGALLAELCCGCAPVGALAAACVPGLRIVAADIDPVAVSCARRNLPSSAVTVCGDLFAPLPEEIRGRIDVLAANAPYVPSAELGLMPREARLHEPVAALDGGSDGLDVHRRLLDGALEWLAPDGSVLIEVAPEQVAEAVTIFQARGFAALVSHDEEVAGTVVSGRRGPPVGVS
jgi:release factor glutamine methyltransferase